MEWWWILCHVTEEVLRRAPGAERLTRNDNGNNVGRERVMAMTATA